MHKLILVMVGGGVGAGLRYLIYAFYHRALTTSFPLGTLTVNAVGCLAIGLIGAVMHARMPEHEVEPWRLLIIVGILGGFTTFSSFGYDTYELFTTGRAGQAVLNIVLNNVVSIAAVCLGVWIARRFVVA